MTAKLPVDRRPTICVAAVLERPGPCGAPARFLVTSRHYTGARTDLWVPICGRHWRSWEPRGFVVMADLRSNDA